MRSIAGVVLAAGASVRMGQCKARLRWRDDTFLGHAIARAREAGCEPVIVVDGAEDLADLIPPGVERIHNPDWSAGRLSSLQLAVRSVVGRGQAAECPAILVMTVDRPRVQSETVRALARASEREPEGVWQPAYRGAHGHPIVYPAPTLDALVALAPDEPEGARRLLRLSEFAARRRFLAVDDPAVVENIDTPADLATLD